MNLNRSIWLGCFVMALCLLCDLTQAAETVVINAGVGGNSTRNLLKRVERDVLAKKPEVVVMMVGTNDALNSSNSVPLKEYRKNLKKLLKQMTAEGAKVVLLTIPPCYDQLLLSRHPAAFYAERAPDDRVADVNEIVRKMAKAGSIQVVDVNELFEKKGGAGPEKSSLLRNEANSRSKDGVHPTSEGYDLIAGAVYQAMKGSKWQAAKTVVCFGDSITYGAAMKGAGTAGQDAETYPAKLARLLNETRQPSVQPDK